MAPGRVAINEIKSPATKLRQKVDGAEKQIQKRGYKATVSKSLRRRREMERERERGEDGEEKAARCAEGEGEAEGAGGWGKTDPP